MPQIVSCSCGAQVRIADTQLGRPVRCPKCQKEFVVTGDQKMVNFAPAAASESGRTCPICQVAIQEGELALACPSCQQVHHRECWAEVGGCSTYGCPQAPAITKPSDDQQRMTTAWGDTKKCPVCGEMIKAIALRCRYCDTDFDTVDPLSMKDLRKRDRKRNELQNLRTTMWLLFSFSMIPCFAPLMLIVDLAVFLPKREKVAKAGPMYSVLGYISLIVTGVFTVLIGLFIVFGRSK